MRYRGASHIEGRGGGIKPTWNPGAAAPAQDALSTALARSLANRPGSDDRQFWVSSRRWRWFA